MSAATYVACATPFAGELATKIAAALEAVSIANGIAWEAVVGPSRAYSVVRARSGR